MYIETVQIKNIGCFADVTLDLRSPQGPKKLAVVVGDNGAGKTTLLRAIAMGLCDKDSTSALLRDTTGDLIREGAKSAIIRVDLRAGAKLRSITTTFAKSGAGFEIVRKQDTQPKTSFPWGSIFLCGYGANRGTEGGSDTERYSAADAVYTLFSYDWPLLNPEVVLWRRTQGKPDQIRRICHAMDQILMLPPDSTYLDYKGLRVSDSRRFVAGVGAMADGYAGTLAWVLDMLGWWYVDHPEGVVQSPEGIVLIDELEQHLHPRWQRDIIYRLCEQFPRLQFIATTHSPLCAIGTTTLSDDDCRLALLRSEGERVICQEGGPPRGQGAGQVLTSWLFGLLTSGDSETKAQIEQYADLLSKASRRPADNDKLRNLRAELDQKLGSAESELESQVRQAVMETLERKGALSGSAKPAIRMEVARQLRELLGND